MQKKLSFSKPLVSLVLSGEKTSTWRLWDDKGIERGDTLYLLESGTGIHFATAKVIKVLVKKMGRLSQKDKEGHEKFKSDLEMYETYSGYYKRRVTPNSEVKIIWFELV